MQLKLGWNLHTFLIVLLLVVASKAAENYYSSSNIIGFAVYEQLDGTCKKYFGDTYCDDSSQDCGQYYQKGTSMDNCDECQTLKDGKVGFSKCVKNAETPATLPSSGKSEVVCAQDVKQCSDGSYVSRDPAKNCDFKACPTSGTVCSDSDGGQDYFVQGVTIVQYPNGGQGSGGDTCVASPNQFIPVTQSEYLFERFCQDSTSSGSIFYKCPNGCKDGACIKEITTQQGTKEQWLVETSANKLELSEELLTIDSKESRETLRDIKKVIGQNELKALSSGQITNAKGISTYNQYLSILGPGEEANKDTGYVRYTEDDLDVTADFLYFKSSREIGTYTIEFIPSLRSDIGNDFVLKEFENIDLKLFGKKYTLATAKLATPKSLSEGIVLTLMNGAEKLELKDTNIYDTASSNTLKANDNFIDDAFVIIEGNNDGTTFNINRIRVNMTADDNFFIPAGGKLSENPDLKQPEVLFTNNWDIIYKGLTEELMEKITLDPVSNTQYLLNFNNQQVTVASLASGKVEFKAPQNQYITNNGMRILFEDHTKTPSNNVMVIFRVDDSKIQGNLKPSDIVVNISRDGNNLNFKSPIAYTERQKGSALNLRTPDGDSNVAYGYTHYGSFIAYKTSLSAPASLQIDNPKNQRFPLTYYLAGVSQQTTSQPQPTKQLPQFIMAVDDKSPTTDVALLSQITQSLQQAGYQVPVGMNKLFSEVNALSLNNMVTLAIYNNQAVIIVGQTSPATHNTFAAELTQILIQKNMQHKAILSSDIKNPNLISLFTISKTTIQGDFDGNGCVEFADFLMFAKAYNSNMAEFDLNGNGAVDFADFLTFNQNFGKGCKEKMEKILEQKPGTQIATPVPQAAPQPAAQPTQASTSATSGFNLKASGKQGSCAGKCNGVGSGNCYCDATSVSSAGDYCMDILTSCPSLSSQVNVKFKQ